MNWVNYAMVWDILIIINRDSSGSEGKYKKTQQKCYKLG